MRGGLAHGAAAALFERHVWDEDGTSSRARSWTTSRRPRPTCRRPDRPPRVALAVPPARREGTRRGDDDERARRDRERRRGRSRATTSSRRSHPVASGSCCGDEARALRLRSARIARRGARGARRAGGEAKVLAGGQSLVPALNMRLLRPRSWSTSTASRARRRHERGRRARSARPFVRRTAAARAPVLAAVLPHVGHTVTRNRGTVCGSIAHADAAASFPLALVAAVGRRSRPPRAGAARSPQRSSSSARTRPRSRRTSSRRDRLAAPAEGEGFAFDELAQRGGDYALCMAAARVRGDDLRVVVGSVTTPRRCSRSTRAPSESAAEQVEPWGSSTPRPSTSATSCASSVDRVVARAGASRVIASTSP